MISTQSDNFKLSEWATNKYNMIYPCKQKEQLIEGLELYKQKIADLYQVDIKEVTVIITDGDRAGKGTGYHYKGYAGDIWTKIGFLDKIFTSVEQMKIIEKLNIFTGRGLYPFNQGFIHVDVRRGLYPVSDNARISRWIRNHNGKYLVYKKDYQNKPFNGLVYPLREE